MPVVEFFHRSTSICETGSVPQPVLFRSQILARRCCCRKRRCAEGDTSNVRCFKTKSSPKDDNAPRVDDAGLPAASQDQPTPDRPSPNELDQDIFAIALPTLATLAADPVAGLVSTAWVGRLGVSQLAAVGVALSLFNTLTKLFNMPLLAVTTSAVAASLGAQGAGGLAEEGEGSRVGLAVSAAIMLAVVTGGVQALLLGGLGVAGLGMWGVGPSSPLHPDASAYLVVRALSAPATVLFLTLQGVFRGLGDTRAPFLATLLSNLANVALEPLLIFGAGWGVRGAAAAIAVAQALSCCVLLLQLSRRCRLQVAGGEALRSTLQFLKPTGLLTLRSLAVSATFALATSLAARTDAAHTAAHQVCFQLWLASSLLADSLAVAAQALIARGLAAGDTHVAQRVAHRTLGLALALGFGLAVSLGLASRLLPPLFTRDTAVLAACALIFPAVAASQPVNSLAFLMDGLLYGVGGFRYAVQAMVVSVLPPVGVLLVGWSQVAVPQAQLQVVWAGLITFMTMRLVTLYIPYRARLPPFDVLPTPAAG